MYNFLRASLVSCLLMVSFAANATSTFVLPMRTYGGSGGIGSSTLFGVYDNTWTPINHPAAPFYEYSIVDLRGVTHFRFSANGEIVQHPYNFEAVDVTLQISIDGGITYTCLSGDYPDCSLLTIPTQSQTMPLVPSPIRPIISEYRVKDAILRVAVRSISTTPTSIRLPQVQAQFYKPW